MNSVEAGPAQVARDEAIALELQRRMALQAAMQNEAQARRAQQQRRVVVQARPRDQPAELPPPSVMMTDPILDTLEAVGTSARDKVLQLWDRMNGKTSSGPRSQSSRQRAGGSYTAVATEPDDEEEDDSDEIAFDTSLTKRLAVEGEGDEDLDAVDGDGVELSNMSAPKQPSGTGGENKKTK